MVKFDLSKEIASGLLSAAETLSENKGGVAVGVAFAAILYVVLGGPLPFVD